MKLGYTGTRKFDNVNFLLLYADASIARVTFKGPATRSQAGMMSVSRSI